MHKNYSLKPQNIIKTQYGDIYSFEMGYNIDLDTVNSFGEEWNKFNQFIISKCTFTGSVMLNQTQLFTDLTYQ